MSGTAEARVLKFCTQVKYIESYLMKLRWQYHTDEGRGQGHMTNVQFRRAQSSQGLKRKSPNFVHRLNISSATFRMTDYPVISAVRVMWPVFNFALFTSFESMKQGTPNVVYWLIQRSTSACKIDYPQNGYFPKMDILMVTWP